MPISRNVTIHQIAMKANVSTATASRAINQPGSVKPETRNRVLQAMKELNYQVKQNSSKLLLATFPDFTNPFNGSCIKGMQGAARKRGYQLLLQQIEEPKNPRSYDFLMNSSMFRGIIFTHTLPDQETMDAIKMRYSVVMCSQYNVSDDTPCVIIDEYAAAKSAISYLLSIGRTQIAMINAKLHHSYAQLRERAYMDALEEAGVSARPGWIAHIASIDYEMAYSAAINMLSASDRPDAVFCVSDVYASAAIKAAGQLGLSVPGDIAVMGFDNVSLCNMTVPAISTVNQPMHQLGWQSCNLLIDQLEGIPAVSRKIVLNTDIVVRSST